MSNRRLALVVAIDRYDQPALHQLASPVADAQALAEVLGDPELGGFEVEVLRNPTSSTLSERVERTLTERHPSDLVLLHFSCHGLKDDAGELHLAATNTIPDLLGSTAVDAAWVSRLMQRSRAQRVVLLLDCCYGGAFERGLLRRASSNVDVGDQFSQRQLGESRGRVVITASTAMEYAFEAAELTEDATVRPSVFTGALVDGIRSGEADRNQDGQVSLGELYDFVYDRVREQTPHQTPSKWEFGLRGDLHVARNPHRRVSVADLAPELLDLIRHPLSGGRSAAVRELARIVAGDDLARAAAARLHLQHLAEDDSRTVSTEANAVLADSIRPSHKTPDPAPAASGEPGRRNLIAVAATALLTGLTVLVAVAMNNQDGDKSKADGISPSSSATTAAATTTSATAPAATNPAVPTNYAKLRGKLPASIRSSCDQGDTAVNLATAACPPGVFRLWLNKAHLQADFEQGGSSRKGSCAKPPSDARRVDADFPDSRSGQLACWLIAGDEYVKPHYAVEWGLHGELVTGTFSTERVDAEEYARAYEKALATLKAMP
jgi:hypothetical protein